MAKIVKDPTTTNLGECGSVRRECPSCCYWIDNSDVSQEWPGLPRGVKFDPSDVELLDHLVAKCGGLGKPSHKFIDEFILTVDNENGICYTHPRDLPGTREDGSSAHFFHRTRNAYASGQRKRRKISEVKSITRVRWHKTGKTKAVIDNFGVLKGWKKIMVLYNCCNRNKNPVKTNWIMHQYHLGREEDETDGEYVVSKIFHKQQLQQQQSEGGARDYDQEEDNDPSTTTTLSLGEIITTMNNPHTPMMVNPPPRPGISSTTTTTPVNLSGSGGGMFSWPYDSSSMLDLDDDGASRSAGLYHQLDLKPEAGSAGIISFDTQHNYSDNYAYNDNISHATFGDHDHHPQFQAAAAVEGDSGGLHSNYTPETSSRPSRSSSNVPVDHEEEGGLMMSELEGLFSSDFPPDYFLNYGDQI